MRQRPHSCSAGATSRPAGPDPLRDASANSHNTQPWKFRIAPAIDMLPDLAPTPWSIPTPSLFARSAAPPRTSSIAAAARGLPRSSEPSCRRRRPRPRCRWSRPQHARRRPSQAIPRARRAPAPSIDGAAVAETVCRARAAARSDGVDSHRHHRAGARSRPILGSSSRATGPVHDPGLHGGTEEWIRFERGGAPDRRRALRRRVGNPSIPSGSAPDHLRSARLAEGRGQGAGVPRRSGARPGS